jgi:hypothetical protein
MSELEPVGKLDHEHVGPGSGNHVSQIPAKAELPGIGIILPVLGPDQIQNGSRPEFPAQHSGSP